jgi:hypothetical protein
VIAKLLKLVDMSSHRAVAVSLLEVVGAQFFVRRLAHEDVIRNREDLMGHRDDRPLVAAAPFNPVVQSGQRWLSSGWRRWRLQ